jgi:hypothetical protein
MPFARPDHRGVRTLLLLVAAAALAWAIAVVATGGFVVRGPFYRLTSRDPVPAFLLSLFAAATYLLRYRRYLATDFAAIGSIRRVRPAWATWPAAALALLALFIGIRWGSFVAAGSDSSGYVSEAELWLYGNLVRPRPTWVADAPWPLQWPTMALGYLPGQDLLTIVPTYAPGLPLMMAMFQGVGGREAVYYVVPLLGALGVWLTYLLGHRLGGRTVGLLSALLLFASPAYLHMLVQPMSDVPSAAVWTLALYFAILPGRRYAVAAGLATGLAILIRPNIVPLAGIVGLVLLTRPSRLPRSLLFGMAVVPAVVLIAALNDRYYGSPLISGYGSLGYLYSLDRAWPNLVRYSRWLVASQTPAILLWVASPWAVSRERQGAMQEGPSAGHRLTVLLVTVAFPLTVLALYLPYFAFDDWTYVRFLLPGFPGLCIGVSGVLVTLASRIRWRAGRVAAPWLVAAAVASYGIQYSGDPFGGVQSYNVPTIRVIDYIPKLPAKSVFVCLTYSGAIQYYTGRDILRWEGFFEPSYLDAAVDYMRMMGYSVYLVNASGEMKVFRDKFAGTRTAQELPPVAPVDLGDALIYPLRGTERPPRP